MNEPISKSAIESILKQSKLVTDNNFLIVNRIVYPKLHTLAKILDGNRGLNGVGPFQGFTEKEAILLFTPQSIFFTQKPSLTDISTGRFSFERIDNISIKNFKVYRKYNQLYISFNYPSGIFFSRIMIQHGFMSDFFSSNLTQLAANGFYGRVPPTEI